MPLVVGRSTVIVQRRKGNQLHTAIDQRDKFLSHFSGVSSFVKVSHQHHHRVLRTGNDSLTISQRTGYIGSSPELYPEKQIHGILQIIRQINDCRIKNHHTGRYRRNGCQHRTEYAGINDRRPHRTALIQTQDNVFHRFPFTPITNTDFGNNRLIVRLVVFQVLGNGRFPIYLIVTRVPATAGTVQSTGYRLLRRSRQFAKQLLNHLADYLACHLLILFRNHPA